MKNEKIKKLMPQLKNKNKIKPKLCADYSWDKMKMKAI